MTQDNNEWKKRLHREWPEKVHELLDQCGFEKDGIDGEKSTTKRSEALSFQAFLFVFVKSFISEVREEARREGYNEAVSDREETGLVTKYQP